MIRTQIYLTDEEKKGLAAVSSLKGISQSDLIRQAVDDLLARTGTIDKSSILQDIAGIWEAREDLPDVRELRTGWRERPVR
ncbi:MAG: ribbon-helix-helix protein, CopG family [Chitinispirillaceae bacterium]|nr:ribbon-helix-helix protein, CopG family [Chitinispirillaceae bacterium]